MTATTEKPMELLVSVEGKITQSNFDDFRDMAVAQIEAINFDLTTDEDFGQAAVDAKQLGEFEKLLDSAEDSILKELDDVYQLIEGTRSLRKLSADKRLALTKAVKTRRDEVVASIISDGLCSIVESPDHFKAELQAAVKGKRKLDTMKSAVAEAVEKINGNIEKCRAIVESYKAKHGDSIAYGEEMLLRGDPDKCEIEMDRRAERMRAEQEKAKLAAEAERLKAEAKAKAEAEKEEPEPATKPEPTLLPEPPKIGSIPVGKVSSPEETAEEEKSRFVAVVSAAFAPVREARKTLKHEENIEAAEEFAQSLAAAWLAFKKGGAE